MAEAATKTILLIEEAKIRTPAVHPTADRTNARSSKCAYIRGTITTSGDIFTVRGMKNIVGWRLFYDGAIPVSGVPVATSATNVLTVVVTAGTIIHGRIWGF